MGEHCVINGERCSKCCEVLTISESKNFRAWRAYARKHDDPDLTDEMVKISLMVKKISKRRAKKVSPHLVRVASNAQAYFTCKNFTGTGCGAYENRPKMCSDYPYYGRTPDEFIKQFVADPDDSYGGKKGVVYGRQLRW